MLRDYNSTITNSRFCARGCWVDATVRTTLMIKVAARIDMKAALTGLPKKTASVFRVLHWTPKSTQGTGRKARVTFGLVDELSFEPSLNAREGRER
jgi:hypothetical protein